MSDYLSLQGLQQRGLQEVGLEGVGLEESNRILEEPEHELGLRNPQEVQQRSSQVLEEPVDLSRVDSSQGVEEAREGVVNLPGRPPAPKPQYEGIILRHPVTKHPIRLPDRMLPEIPNDMTKEDLARVLQEKINRGHELVQQILDGTLGEHETTMQNVTDVMWYLHTAAEFKAGTNWKEGAISFEDPIVEGSDPPIGRLQQFLDKCSGHAYQRMSTHVEGFQSTPGGYPRGIDCYGDARNPDSLLPNGRQTILYQKMGTEGSDRTPGMPRNMLLLKMEGHGCYSARQQVPERGPTRQENQHDREAFWGHVGSTIKSILRRLTGTNSPAGSRKERVSSGMQKAYDKLAKWHLFGSSLPSEVRTILQRNNPGNTASGVRVMKQNIDQAIAFLRDRPGSERHIAKLEAFAQKYFTNPQWDHLDMRIGNEVILTREDINNPQRVSKSEGQIARQLTNQVNKNDLVRCMNDDVQETLNAPEGSGTYNDLQPVEGLGVCGAFVKDMMNRAGKLTIDGQEVPWDGSEDPPGKGRLEALKAFFTRDGVLDEEGLLLASRLLNQSVTSTITRAETGQLPNGEERLESLYQGIPAMEKQQVNYEIFRDGEQVHVRIRVENEGNQLVFHSGDHAGEMVDLSQQGGVRTEGEIGLVFPGNNEGERVSVVDVDYRMITKQ